MFRRFFISERAKKIALNTALVFVFVIGITAARAGSVRIAANLPPIASPDSYSVEQDKSLNIAAPGVLANDSDPDGRTMGVFVVTTTHAGTLTMQGNGSFEYYPNAGFIGNDSFQYMANDGVMDSNVVTVDISVTRKSNPPFTQNDTYSTPVNVTLHIDAPGVLQNDAINAKLKANLEVAPKYGAVSLATDGSFDYVPETQWNGVVVFKYRASNGYEDSASTTVSVQVGIPNGEPTAANDQTATQKNKPVVVDVLANDADPEGIKKIFSAPAHSAREGYLSISEGKINYEPMTNFVGDDTFDYVMTDGSYRETATVTVHVNDPGTPVDVVPVAPSLAPATPTSSSATPTPSVENVSTPTALNPATSMLVPGSLVKSSVAKAVYWIDADGKRWVFPSEGAYHSWYPDFSGIITLTPVELASHPLGGNVVYRPGIRMLKLPSDPTVYAVDHAGVLRPIASEEVIFRVYGSTWSTYIDDLSEAFFFNYSIGAPITGANQFNPDNTANATKTILENKKPAS
jgi:hypothetical protein